MVVVYDKVGFSRFRKTTIDELLGVLEAARSRLGSVNEVRLPNAYASEQAKLNGVLSGLVDTIDVLDRLTDAFDHKLRLSAERYESSDAKAVGDVAEAGGGLL